MDYAFSVRNIRRGAFGSEPGASHFLAVPQTVAASDPAHRITKRDWFARVQEEAKSGTFGGHPSGDIVMYVHGYKNSQTTMLARHRKIRKGLEAHGFGGVVVIFDWPSADNALNYLEDRTDAKKTALRLVDEGIASFAALQRPDCRINVHLLAHSMGCYVVREAFDDADDRPAVAAHSWSVSQVMLVGADLSAASLADGNSKSSSLYRHCVRLTSYFNPFDNVLSLSNIKRIGVSPRAGRIGLPDRRPEKAVNIYCGDYFDRHKDMLGDHPNVAHSWYFDDAHFLQDVFLTVQGVMDRHEFPTREPHSQGNLALKP
ncbi:alpha/beta hydrolase [Rhodovulum tesquicola]|uniref:alpha/beta hydrolase n=1 Tax=Rhodovulum tesquicola TaxID=540254 RepID=UPI0020971236|nr:alpha/beta hydrolase [Rhodovulum tesquicola]MCO8145833.1 alpha/beta hydrolase [Rhodovulum tesquicola]